MVAGVDAGFQILLMRTASFLQNSAQSRLDGVLNTSCQDSKTAIETRRIVQMSGRAGISASYLVHLQTSYQF